MCVVCSMAYSGLAAGLAVANNTGLTVPPASMSGQDGSAATQVMALQSLPETLAAIKSPQLKEPQWLIDIKIAERAAAEAAGKRAAAVAGQKIVVTYSVTTRGVVTANLNEFKQQANATFNDPRGWAAMGVFFQEVANGGQFTLVLSEASQLPSFSSGCSSEYSCNVGRFVIINQDRWMGATPSWNAASGSLRDYRHMVVNHETGHWLGHGHRDCGGPGQPAPVMQQQSINLQGCSFNPWPLKAELSSTRLGIK